jgi:hypothetical protein
MATAPMAAKAGPGAHMIHIIEFPDGTFAYLDQDKNEARRKKVNHHDGVGWESITGKDFTITFAEWPFTGTQEVLYSQQGKVSPRQVKGKGEVKEKHPYKYTVSMPGLPPDDPDIIIDPCT